jgi:hypothetical protein
MEQRKLNDQANTLVDLAKVTLRGSALVGVSFETDHCRVMGSNSKETATHLTNLSNYPKRVIQPRNIFFL